MVFHKHQRYFYVPEIGDQGPGPYCFCPVCGSVILLETLTLLITFEDFDISHEHSSDRIHEDTCTNILIFVTLILECGLRFEIFNLFKAF